MKYLSGVCSGLTGTEGIGLMVQPGNNLDGQVARFPFHAADNGCFAAGVTFDPVAWLEWLAADVTRERCLFAVAPDVLADAAATLDRSIPYLHTIRELGFPAALVAQDGLETLPVPWATFDVLFVGGSTEWKLSAHVAALMAAAHEHCKPVHVGRVNSRRRFSHFASLGADSADGTILAFGPDANVGRVRSWIAAPPMILRAIAP